MLEIMKRQRVRRLEGEIIVYLFALFTGILGAVLFLFGIQPSLSLNGGSANMPLVTLGIALIIGAGTFGAIMMALGGSGS